MVERVGGKNVKIYDISMSISSDMQVYKNKAEKKPLLKVVRDFTTSDIFESKIEFDMHTGTHIDAPLHVIENGRTIDDMDLNKVITKCKVLDMTSVSKAITESDLVESDIRAGDFVLFKTRNSFMDEFEADFVYLHESGARYLKDRKINGVGIDSLGIERDQPGRPTHKLLLESEILLIEGLRLADVEEGEYTLIALPLKIRRAEASPVRAVLFKDVRRLV